MTRSASFEVVQLENGDFALAPTSGGREPLVTIKFGSDAKAFLAEKDANVAYAMIKAAVKAVSDINEDAVVREANDQEHPTEDSKRTLH